MKLISSVLLIVSFYPPMVIADAPVRFSGHLVKYDTPVGSPQVLYGLQARDHVQSNLKSLWLVDADLSRLENGAKVLVEGTIRTKLIPEQSGSTSSIPNVWEVWMEVRRYKVIKDFAAADFGGTESKANGSQSRAPDMELPVEVAKASAAFKTGSGARYTNDYTIPRTILPWIKAGMTKHEIESLLGPPDSVSGSNWGYTLFYSMFIAVKFDAQGNVLQVSSPLLSEPRKAEPVSSVDGRLR